MASKLYVLLVIFIGSCRSDSRASAGWSSSSSCPGNGIQPEVAQTPGLLGTVLPYVGHHDCTDAGVCVHEPLNCPWSPCCLSVGNTATNSTATETRCGCINENGICVPYRSVRVGWTTCESGLQLRSDFEIAKLPCDEVTCLGSTATVQFEVNPSGQVSLNIVAKSCPRAVGDRRGTLGGVTGLLIDTVQDITINFVSTDRKAYFLRFCGQLLKELPMEQIVEYLESTQLQHIKSLSSNRSNVSSPQNSQQREIKVSKECLGDTSTFFSMSPTFQTGVLDVIQSSLKEKFCSASGQCRNAGSLHYNCTSGRSCCVLGNALNTKGSKCQCIPGINSCLENKQLQTNFEICTNDGGSVSSSTSFHVLLDGATCTESEAEFEMDMEGNTRFVVVVRLQKCVPLAAGRNFVLVEHTISAVQNIGQFVPTLKAYAKSLESPDWLDILGKERVRSIAAYLERENTSVHTDQTNK